MTFDFDKRRAIIAEGSESARITFTTVHDLAAVVALAVDYQGEWPVVGGICGDKLTVRELLELGERIRGKSTRPLSLHHANSAGPFNVETLDMQDLQAASVKSSWMPIPAEVQFFAAHLCLGVKGEVSASSQEQAAAGLQVGLGVGCLDAGWSGSGIS